MSHSAPGNLRAGIYLYLGWSPLGSLVPVRSAASTWFMFRAKKKFLTYRYMKAFSFTYAPRSSQLHSARALTWVWPELIQLFFTKYISIKWRKQSKAYTLCFDFESQKRLCTIHHLVHIYFLVDRNIVVIVILSQYLNRYKVPMPTWSRRGGFKFVPFPLFELFPVRTLLTRRISIQ